MPEERWGWLYTALQSGMQRSRSFRLKMFRDAEHANIVLQDDLHLKLLQLKCFGSYIFYINCHLSRMARLAVGGRFQRNSLDK